MKYEIIKSILGLLLGTLWLGTGFALLGLFFGRSGLLLGISLLWS